MKIKKYKMHVIFSLALLIGLAWLAYAQIMLAIVNVIPPGACEESDGGFNIQTAGCISGVFGFNTSSGNLIFNGTFCDSCGAPTSGNSTAVIELVCGQNIAPQYNSLAGAILVPCPTGSGLRGICARGRCL